MLGEIGVGWRPKTKPKNKLRLKMKKLLNPKLAQEEITVIEDSSSQEELEEYESLNVREIKGKKQVPLKDKSASTGTKISELLKQVQRKVKLSHHQDGLVKQQSVMTGLCADEERIAEPSTKCSFEGNESPGVPVTMKEQHQEEVEKIFKRLKIPQMPERLSSASEGKCIISENENLQRSIKQYKYHIQFMHETNEVLVVANKILREDLDEINSH